MKKVLLFICFLVSANILFAQSTASLALNNIEVTDAASQVEVAVNVTSLSNLIVGVQLSIYYDPAYLTWAGTQANPGPGVAYLAPGFTAIGPDYLWNTGFTGNLIMTWIDPTYAGFSVAPGNDLIRYKFNYNGSLAAGAESAIYFSLTAVMKDGGYTKIVNELTDENFSPYNWVGPCGGLCPGKIWRAGGVLAPVADFSATPLSGDAPLFVNFTDLSTNTPTSWSWAFGDGGTSTLQNPAYTYTVPGTYTVSLTATNLGGSNTMTKTGYIVVTPPCVPGTWTGLSLIDPTDWFDAANWSCNIVPDNIDVIIPGGTKAMVTISGGIATTAALTVGVGGGVIIASDGGLTTNGTYTNDGSLLIQSDLGGYSGTFIHNGVLAGAGTFEMDRFMTFTGTTAGATDPNWHYITAPIGGFTNHEMFDYYVNDWDPTTSSWIHVEGMAPNCTGPAPMIPLGGVDAWSVNMANDYTCQSTYPGTGTTLEFVGNAADVPFGVYAAPAVVGPAPYGQWNMFGNPYPAGLDLNTIAFDPNMVPGVALYDAGPGNYLYWTPAVGSYVMPVGNGFFTEWTGPGVFSVTNASRAHNADFFYKADVSNLVTLQVTGNEKSDITHIRFMEEAQPVFAKDGDFHKLFSTAVPQIYTTAGEDKLAINALPETTYVPMGMTSEVSGSYTISAIETSDFENIVLEDLFLGIQTDLLTGNYTFDYNVGDNESRFIVHFTPLGTPELSANSINIWAANQTIYVQAPATTGDIVVYNLMGQEVVRTAIEPGVNEIPMNESNTYYIVKVLGSEITETGKVFIK